MNLYIFKIENHIINTLVHFGPYPLSENEKVNSLADSLNSIARKQRAELRLAGQTPQTMIEWEVRSLSEQESQCIIPPNEMLAILNRLKTRSKFNGKKEKKVKLFKT